MVGGREKLDLLACIAPHPHDFPIEDRQYQWAPIPYLHVGVRHLREHRSSSSKKRIRQMEAPEKLHEDSRCGTMSAYHNPIVSIALRPSFVCGFM